MKEVSLFEFDSYKAWLRRWLQDEGRGALSRLAEALRVQPSFVSQVANRDKGLSPEQALKLAEFVGMGALERDYFLQLVLEERAGSVALASYFSEKRQSLRKEAGRVSRHVGKARALTPQAQARFYSDANYSLIRLLTSLDDYRHPAKIAAALSLPLGYVKQVLAFLLEHGLCLRDGDGAYRMGSRSTHLDVNSPWITNHHRNWRSKVTELYPRMDTEDLAFSAPLTLSRRDFARVRKLLLELIQTSTRIVADTEVEEEFVVFNIDWVRLHPSK